MIGNTYWQCFGSGYGTESESAWIRIDFALLDPDLDPYWGCGSGSGSRSKKIDKTKKIILNLTSSLSKRL
jgi:hypothetical protein